MGDSTARSLVLFFYFSLLDGELSLKLARQCGDALRLAEYQSPNEAKSRFIQTTLKHFRTHAHLRRSHGGSAQIQSPSYIQVDPADLKVWYDYWKKASDEEVLGVIWTKIIGLSEYDVARGLELTEGSLSHRISVGLRRAGESVQNV